MYVKSAAAAAILAASMLGALGSAATASAEKSWDIGQYDSCMRNADIRSIENDWGVSQLASEQRKCCLASGGVFQPDTKCVAPPAEQRSPNDYGQPTKPLPAIPKAGEPPVKA